MYKIRTFLEGCGDTCTANKSKKIYKFEKSLKTKLRSQSENILVVYQVSHKGPFSKALDCK